MRALLLAVAMALTAPAVLAQESDPVFDEDEVPFEDTDPFRDAEAEADMSLGEAAGEAGAGEDEGADGDAGAGANSDAAPPPVTGGDPKKTPAPAAVLALGVLGLAALALRRK